MKAASFLLALVCLATLSGKDKIPPVVANEKVLVLEPFKVSESPLISYAIDIAVYAEPKTKTVTRIFITRVLEDTDAARAGLQPGDEIVSLDGVPVKGMEARVGPDSALGRFLLNRDHGEKLNFEIITRRTEKVTLRAQRGIPGISR
jgi:predicted metalloprotease with PDZ domain